LVQIDNFKPDLVPRLIGRNSWEMGGDNSSWEFSGWKRAIGTLKQLGVKADVLIFINDACLNHNRDELYYRMRFDWRCLNLARTHLVGCIDHSDCQHLLLGHDVSTFVRSNFFAMPHALAGDLAWTFAEPDLLSRILPERLSEPVISRTEELNENFRSFLENWITVRWHRSAKPTPTNWPFLRQKAVACLNERMLTAMVRQKGYPTFDATNVLWG
jgi:hypothetical protein